MAGGKDLAIRRTRVRFLVLVSLLGLPSIAPLIPSLELAVENEAVTAYLPVVAAIMQEGMVLHELAVNEVNKRRSRINSDG